MLLPRSCVSAQARPSELHCHGTYATCRSVYTTQKALDECYMQLALDLGLEVLSKHPIEVIHPAAAAECMQRHAVRSSRPS